jgi:hypothetical protein
MKPVPRLFLKSSPVGCWPAYFSSAGLGSNVSTCEGPPFMKRKITRLALGAKCGARTLSTDEAIADRGSMDASAAIPNPAQLFWSICRRLTCNPSVHIKRLIARE